jgi:hypothetical protein
MEQNLATNTFYILFFHLSLINLVNLTEQVFKNIYFRNLKLTISREPDFKSHSQLNKLMNELIVLTLLIKISNIF